MLFGFGPQCPAHEVWNPRETRTRKKPPNRPPRFKGEVSTCFFFPPATVQDPAPRSPCEEPSKCLQNDLTKHETEGLPKKRETDKHLCQMYPDVCPRCGLRRAGRCFAARKVQAPTASVATAPSRRARSACSWPSQLSCPQSVGRPRCALDDKPLGCGASPIIGMFLVVLFGFCSLLSFRCSFQHTVVRFAGRHLDRFRPHRGCRRLGARKRASQLAGQARKEARRQGGRLRRAEAS